MGGLLLNGDFSLAWRGMMQEDSENVCAHVVLGDCGALA